MPGKVPGPSPTPPISLVKASAGKQPLLCLKGRWLNSKAAPWGPRLPWRCHIPAFASLTAFALPFFFFLLHCPSLQTDQKHKVLPRQPCVVASKSLLSDPVTPLSVGLLVGLPALCFREQGRTEEVSRKQDQEEIEEWRR